MIKVVLALACIATCASAQLGSNKCTWGPSYWCSTVDAANSCNSLDYCHSQGLLLDTDTIKPSPVECKLCHLAVENVVKNLTSNSSIDHIEEELSKVCSKLGGFAAVCQDFVEKYTPELVSILAQDLNATSVCIKLGFCANTTTTSVHAQTALKDMYERRAIHDRASPADCKLCTYIIGQLEGKVTANSTVQEIEAALDKVCGHMGTFAKVCESLVTKYTPELIAALLEDVNATHVCSKIGLCPKEEQQQQQQQQQQASPLVLDGGVGLAVAQTLTLGGAIGLQGCAQGPSYWCRNAMTANECNAVPYCKDKAN